MKKINNKAFLLKSGFFIISFSLATYLVLWIEKLKPSDLGTYKNLFIKEVIIKKSDFYSLRKPVKELTLKEMEYAKTAWKYFENNSSSTNGAINGRENVNTFNMSDMTSYLLGLVSAYELNIVDSVEFNKRLTATLTSMRSMPLYENKLPNKTYSTSDFKMLDDKNSPSASGSGWSALHIGRFYTFVEKILMDYPGYVSLVKEVIGRWRLEDMIVKGSLYGVNASGKTSVKFQEGKLGYEEYCAKALIMAGYDVSDAMSYTDFIKFVNIYDIEIGVDTRDHKDKSDDNYLLSDPYILDGIEYGWDINSQELAYRVFNVQKSRYKKTNIITAVSEDYTSLSPNYIYNTIYVDDETWHCVDSNGEDASELKTISTKAAFGWNVLFQDNYADILLETVKGLNDPERGWFSGKYEKSGKINTTLTAATNGMILECLNYKVHRKLISL